MPTDTAPKELIICPFSRKQCRQCALYRGRHYELCSLHNTRLKAVRAAKAKAWTNHGSTRWEMPEIPDGANIIVDIENFVEKRDA